MIANVRLEIPSTPGTYTLIIDVSQPVKTIVGKMGFTNFDSGFYMYTGSAIGQSVNLRTRINRHLIPRKKNHWHIDYLLNCNNVAIKAVIFVESDQKRECWVVRNLGKIADGGSG